MTGIYKDFSGDLECLEEYERAARKTLAIYMRPLSQIIDELELLENQLFVRAGARNPYPTADISVSPNGNFTFLCVKSFQEAGVAVKELVVPAKFKIKTYIDDPDQFSSESEDIQESSISDEALTPKALDDLAKRLILEMISPPNPL